MDLMQTVSDECDHECHAPNSMSLCDGSCCRPCHVCNRSIRVESYEDHGRRNCQPAQEEAQPSRSLGAMNAFEMIPGTGIETVLERELDKINGKGGK